MDVDTFYLSLGKAIKKKRKAKKMSAEELGEAVGLKRATISNIENANQSAYIHVVWDIAMTLGCKSINELLPNGDQSLLEKSPYKEEGVEWLKSIQ